jgi:hypothetical protein
VIPEHRPAVPEEPVTVCVKKFSKRTRGPGTQVRCDLGVIHAEKLEQLGALGHLFNVTSEQTSTISLVHRNKSMSAPDTA